jgi:hypothetical protein
MRWRTASSQATSGASRHDRRGRSAASGSADRRASAGSRRASQPGFGPAQAGPHAGPASAILPRARTTALQTFLDEHETTTTRSASRVSASSASAGPARRWRTPSTTPPASGCAHSRSPWTSRWPNCLYWQPDTDIVLRCKGERAAAVPEMMRVRDFGRPVGWRSLCR